MRIQYEVSDKQLEAIKALVEITGVKTRTELLNNALALFEWAVKEKKSGRTIASLDETDNVKRELVIPALSSL
jgi:hypothetical protein